MSSPAALPLYAQIAARLRAAITAGQYPVGSRIPSEHELAEQFGVGRPTVRQATEQLVRERVLDRRRGSGTYVSEAPRSVDLFSAGGTLASFAKSGLEVSVRLLGRVRRREIDAEPRALAGREAFCLARVSRVAGTAVLLEDLYFDPAAFPGLDKLPLAGRSLSELTRERYLLVPVKVQQSFSVGLLDAQRAEALGAEVGAAVVKVERTIDFTAAPGALHAVLWCRTDQVQFTQTLVLDGAEARAATPQ